MPQLSLEASGRAVANVPRSFFCTRHRRGVRPEECQQCWVESKVCGFAKSHGECIKTYRDVAMLAFGRKPLDSMEKALWGYLHFNARGKERAITADRICEALGTEAQGSLHLSEDTLRRIIRECLREKGYLVISTNSGKGAGFFVPKRNEEVMNFLRTMKSRKDAIGDSMLKTARFLHRSSERLAELGLTAEGVLEE